MNITFECEECFSAEEFEPHEIRLMEHWICPKCGNDGYCFNKSTALHDKDMCSDCDGEREPAKTWVLVDRDGNEID